RGQLVAAVPVPVVVPEDCGNRNLDSARRVEERIQLAELPVPRQVAGQQDEIRLARGIREHGPEALVPGPACMHVSRGGDLDHNQTVPRNGSWGNHAQWRISTTSSTR